MRTYLCWNHAWSRPAGRVEAESAEAATELWCRQNDVETLAAVEVCVFDGEELRIVRVRVHVEVSYEVMDVGEDSDGDYEVAALTTQFRATGL